MDQTEFVKLINDFAHLYYSVPRSTEVPTPNGPVNLTSITAESATCIWAVEDFANWLKDSDNRTQRERMRL